MKWRPPGRGQITTADHCGESFSGGTTYSVSRALLGTVAYPGILFGGGSTNSVEDGQQRERESGGGNPIVRGSGGSCNLVNEIAFHIVKFA